jgi:hypothetical protein
MKRTLGFPAFVKPLYQFASADDLKASSHYIAAKAGNSQAALHLISDLALAWLYGVRERFAPGLIYVAPHAREATGDNAIPQTLAAVCALLYDGKVDEEIVQTDQVFHTGANAMERMVARAQFKGKVDAGAKYVLVDDVTNLGGALAELANYVQFSGGVVHDVIVLANAGRNKGLQPNKKFVRLIKERFDEEFIEGFGIEPTALTANEAEYLVGFSTIDGIRNRVVAARKEIDCRIRSKGVASIA